MAGSQLTPFGNFMFASPFKWVVIFAPLAMVFFLSARINRMSLGAAQTRLLGLRRADGRLDLLDLPGLCRRRASRGCSSSPPPRSAR